MSKTNNLSKSFPKGEKADETHFIGTAWVETLVSDQVTFKCSIWNVTFEPGARNNWHSHPGGQMLLVTAGRGYYQEAGQPARELHEGDVVLIQPDIKHWHGAAADSGLTHIAICTNPEKGGAVWFEPVSNEDYSRLK